MKKVIIFLSIPIFLYLMLNFFIEPKNDLMLIILVISIIMYWALNIIPDYQASLIFLLTCLIFSLSEKELIFSGFTSSAFWLVLAGMLIASAIKNVHLTKRISAIFYQIQHPSYLLLLSSVAIFALFFSFIMPSGVGRNVLFIPLAIGIAQSYGFKPNQKGYTGIMLTFILITTIPAFTILPANVPNMILAGLTQQLFGYELLYSFYLSSTFVVLGILKSMVIVSIIYILFKDTPTLSVMVKSKEPFSNNEYLVIVVMFLLIFFWMSDFYHGIAPAMIAMIGVLFLAFPSINVIQTKDFNSINFSSVLFIVGIISLSNVVANNDYIKELLSHFLQRLPWTESSFLNFMLATVFMAVSGVVITQPTVPAIFTPLSEQLVILSGFTLEEVFILQITAFSTVFFPFQSPPLIIGLTLAKVKITSMLKVLFLLSAITIGILFPLEYFWLKYIL